MRSSKLSAKNSLIGAIAVLGASVGAVSTAYSEPMQLSAAQMDGITAGSGHELCTTCPESPAPTITRDDLENGTLLIKWSSTDLPAIQLKMDELGGILPIDLVTITTDSIAIKID